MAQFLSNVLRHLVTCKDNPSQTETNRTGNKTYLMKERLISYHFITVGQQWYFLCLHRKADYQFHWYSSSCGKQKFVYVCVFRCGSGSAIRLSWRMTAGWWAGSWWLTSQRRWWWSSAISVSPLGKQTLQETLGTTCWAMRVCVFLVSLAWLTYLSMHLVQELYLVKLKGSMVSLWWLPGGGHKPMSHLLCITHGAKFSWGLIRRKQISMSSVLNE